MQQEGQQSQRWRLVVPTGGDTLRQERLTRDLHSTLSGVGEFTCGFVDDDNAAADGQKGAGAGDVALWAAVAAASSRTTSRVLITLIKEWCARERHRKVELTYGDHSVVIPSRPDPVQERMVNDFLDRLTANEHNRTDGDAS
ncbi:hypothetical protein ACFXKS_25015 [Streptomyces scopuliridis]|uniref:hypothetical protein n=1 Tax=Streptomyces scopuliridis TaxID=452529 RepID=UPI00367C5EB8